MTPVEICNHALLRLNQSPINELTNEGTIQARSCKLLYDETRRYVLSQHAWDFATIPDVPLSLVKCLNYDEDHQPPFDEAHPKPDPSDPATYKNPFRYSYLYNLPGRLLSIVDVYLSDGTPVSFMGGENGLRPYEKAYFSSPTNSGYDLGEGVYLYSTLGGEPVEGNNNQFTSNLRVRAVLDIDDTNLFSSLFTQCLILRLAYCMQKSLNDSLQYSQLLGAEYLAQLNQAILKDAQQSIPTNENRTSFGYVF
jgi:hypothetical protein